nr:hypothetical protein [Escherichia coli]
MVFAMSKSNLIAFRIPSELQDEFNRSVLASGGDKTSWLVDAIRMKLGQPEKSIDSRMLGLVERMEKAAASLIAGKPNIPPKPYNETAVIKIIADTIQQGFDNGRVIAERINEAGYQTKAGKAWDIAECRALIVVVLQGLRNQALAYPENTYWPLLRC